MSPSSRPVRDLTGGRSRGRLAVAAWCALLCVAGAVTADAAPGPPCTAPQLPHIIIETVEGAIEIELLPAAAPTAVARLIRLVEGPVFPPEITAGGRRTEIAGYYDGLELDLAYPGKILATAVRPPADTVLIATEIDAVALGLDTRTIADGEEAMQVWQFELFPAQAGADSDEAVQPRLRDWLARWAETFNADFLIGVSRQEINEALGYRYTRGLESIPVTRGTVALEPLDPLWSTPRLVFALADAPRDDGRRMVVGRVASGLELVERIAARRLSPAKAVRNRPLDPVRISRARVECRAPMAEPMEGKGAE